MKILHNCFILFFCTLQVLCFVSCREKKLPAQVHLSMDTVCSVNLYDDGTSKLYKEIFDRLDDIDSQFSITKPDSFTSRINESAGTGPVPVSEDVLTVLELSSLVSKITGGALDVTANPLIQLWGINTEKARVPSQNEIDTALEKTGFERMHFADNGVPWCILEQGMSINFGAVAKGYAGDVLVSILEEHNVRKAVLDLGGNIICFGKKEDGRPWTVGIKNPAEPSGKPLLKLLTEETAVVTSGNYERFFEQDGKRYHHIFDLKTGYPAENELASVTVICRSSTISDALSTACFVLGQEGSLECMGQFEKLFGIQIGLVFIHKDGKVSATENLRDSLSFYGDSAEQKIDFVQAVPGETL